MAASTIKKLYFASGADVTEPTDLIPGGTTAYNSPYDAQNYSVACSAAANALTIALKNSAGTDPSGISPCVFSFRNTTAATGDFSSVSSTAATSIVLSSGSTLGQTSGAAATIFVYVLNNAGTVELAVTGTKKDESIVHTTTAEGGAGGADSATTLYSSTSRTGVAIRLIAVLVNTQATAGSWASVPSKISLTTSTDNGLLGEIISSGAMTEVTTNAGSFTDVTGASITLPAGKWNIKAYFVLIMAGPSGTGTAIVQVYDSSNVFIGGNAQVRGTSGDHYAGQIIDIPVTVYTSTTYKLRIYGVSCNATFRINNDQSVANDSAGAFYAVRVGNV